MGKCLLLVQEMVPWGKWEAVRSFARDFSESGGVSQTTRKAIIPLDVFSACRQLLDVAWKLCQRQAAAGQQQQQPLGSSRAAPIHLAM